MQILKSILSRIWTLLASLWHSTKQFISDIAAGRNERLTRFGQRLAAWLVAVTWKRLIVVLMLLVIAGGMVSSCVENLFRRERIETITQVGRAADDEREKDRDSASKRSSPKITVSADGVVLTDPETGQRVIIDSKGIRPLKTPNVEAVTPDAPTVPASPKPPAPPKPPGTADDTERAKRDLPQARRDAAQAAKDAASALSNASKLRITLGGKQFDVISSEAAEAIQEAIDNAEMLVRESVRAEMRDEIISELRNEIRRELQVEMGEPRTTTKRTVIKSGEWLSSLITAMMGLLVVGLIGGKVVFNTQAKAAARVASAEEATERETLKRQLVEARLTTMQAQVEPHFLFNTLASVEHLIEVDPKRAALMQHNLIEYLRAAMPHLRDSTSTLGREQSLLNSYLALLQFRMEERLQYSVQIPSGLHSAEIPPMMLLSLVENAIKHGLEPKPEGGRIDVVAEIVDGGLRVSVRDTGLGFRAGPVDTSGTGVGISNLTERLRMLYGDAAKFNIGPAPDGAGTLAVMDLPYRVKK